MHFEHSDFKKMSKDYAKFDSTRDKLIGKSRSVIKLSKKLIYDIHRQDFKSADIHNKKIRAATAELKRSATGELEYSGILRNALQEFVEAVCFYDLETKGKLPTSTELKMDTDSYLLGICDLTGELGRKAVKLATYKDVKGFDEIKEFMDKIYGMLIEFNFRNSELRKKFDGVKYTIKKLEDIKFDLAKN